MLYSMLTKVLIISLSSFQDCDATVTFVERPTTLAKQTDTVLRARLWTKMSLLMHIGIIAVSK
jgi:hypothetical protein